MTEPNDKQNSLTHSEGNTLNRSWSDTLGFLGFGLIFAFLVFWNTCHIWVLINDLHMNDFGKFYYATVAFLNGQDMYGPNPATYIQVTDDHGQNFWNLNPPHFHILLLPLALLPEFLALALWSACNFVALFVVLNWIQGELKLTPTLNQSRLLTIGFLAFSGTGAHLITGQLSFLLILPVTLAWIHARHNQWGKTGLYLGIACSAKLFFLIFIPYLFLRRQFKSIAVFAGVLFSAFGIGILLFGMETHRAWVARLAEVDWHWASMNASLLGTLSRTFSESPTFNAAIQAEVLIYPFWFLLSGIVALTTFFVAACDTSTHSVDRAFAILLLGAILISPLGWTYYLFLLLGPLTAVVYNWYKQSHPENSRKCLGARRAQNFLLLGAIPGLLVPLVSLILFKESSLLTVSIGSSYFWSTLMVWMYVIIDWRRDNSEWAWTHKGSLDKAQGVFPLSANQTRTAL